jgi:hypothetical protein
VVTLIRAFRTRIEHHPAAVNPDAAGRILRDAHDSASIHLRGRTETLPVSRRYLHLFRTM